MLELKNYCNVMFVYIQVTFTTISGEQASIMCSNDS